MPEVPQPIFSVSDFLDLINELLAVRDFEVVGEVVGAKEHPTGIYFSLKDPEEGGIMDCYLSPYVYRSLGVTLEDGMLVQVGGLANIYKPRGRFSFRVRTLQLAGEGSLKKAYEALKKKLIAEGLFERKRAVPEFISRVGLITSKTGAVIDDFRKNLLPLGISVTHYDVRVEGAQATPQVRAALDWFGSHPDDVDVIVLVRGGGSLEDLQAFNDEHVVRGVFGSPVPTLVSIGHDRDVPLAQMVADASASTPTAAAHVVNDSWDRLRKLDEQAQLLTYRYESSLTTVQADIAGHAHRLTTELARLSGTAERYQQRLSGVLATIGERIASMRDTLTRSERQLVASNPERLLGLGYSIVNGPDGTVVRTAEQLRHDQEVTTRLGKGAFVSTVKEILSK